MRSLAIKLTLAFLTVGLMGTVLVAFFVGWRTRQDFDRFVFDQDRYALVGLLAQYHQNNGSWAGVESVFTRGRYYSPRRGGHFPQPVLIGVEGTVIAGSGHYQVGDYIPANDRNKGVSIEVDDAVVGWLLLESPAGPPLPGTPEAVFLNRVTQAIIYGSLGATGIALLLGVLLARNISRPVRELTAATQRVAQGDLGHQVPVYTRDELGELAGSFNRMSTDLARANQVRRQMTADIAHDLRTPLSVVLGYAEALRENKLQPTPEIFNVMHQEAQHLRRLIDDLRTLSLADSGELTLSRQPIAPMELLERTAAAHKALAAEKEITIQIQGTPNLPTIKVDPDRMDQVLDNLLTNALRYTPEGGSITLIADMSPGPGTGEPRHIRIRVRDTGAGISPADLPNIFNRFYRGDKARQENGESGLGLAIARSLIELHGGTISVESTQEVGSTFTILLPIEG